MTAETGDVVGHDHSIANLEFAHVTPDLDHSARNLVTQDRRLFQPLKADLVDIRKTNPTGLDLEQQIPLLKRRSGYLLNSRLMVLRNEGFHGERSFLFTRDKLNGKTPGSKRKESRFEPCIVHLRFSQRAISNSAEVLVSDSGMD
jgi:hypothetical protein